MYSTKEIQIYITVVHNHFKHLRLTDATLMGAITPSWGLILLGRGYANEEGQLPTSLSNVPELEFLLKIKEIHEYQPIFVLDRNTWNHRAVSKLFVFDKNTWNHRTVCKLFVLDRNTWNHTTLWKLFILDWNIWNHTTVFKLFVLDWSTWNRTAVCKLFVLRIFTSW